MRLATVLFVIASPMKRLAVLMLASSIISMAGCTLLAHGTTDRVTIQSEPSGVPVNFGGQETRTPGAVMVSRRHDFAVLRANAPGYEPYCKLVKSKGDPLLTTLDSIPESAGERSVPHILKRSLLAVRARVGEAP